MRNILVVVAHQDDEALGCGGTLAKHISNGDRVKVVFVSDGYSSRDDGENRDYAAIDYAKLLKLEKPIFLDYKNNRMDSVDLLDIIKKIERIVEEYKPEVVYTHHYGDLNIDHQVTHRATITACRPQPGFSVKEIYSFEVLSSTGWQSKSMGPGFDPSYYVDISNFFHIKVSSLKIYDDEMRNYPHSRSYQAVESLAKYRGSSIGVKYAEAFQVERCIV